MNVNNVISFLAAASLAAGCLLAQPGQLNKISNNTPGFIKKAVDQGAVDPASVMTVNVWLKLHNQQQLDNLVQQQKQKGSPSYQRWITQDQFNATYSPTSQEVNAISNFLSAKNLTVVWVAENNLYVKAQGAVPTCRKPLASKSTISI